jgi:dGTPase
LNGKRLLAETIRRMLSEQVYDIIRATRQSLAELEPLNIAAVRNAAPLLRFSAGMRAASSELKRFLFANLYRHEQVQATRGRAERVLRDLFQAYLADSARLPADFAGSEDHARACADYIAGMTDRFALREHERLTGQRLFG